MVLLTFRWLTSCTPSARLSLARLLGSARAHKAENQQPGKSLGYSSISQFTQCFFQGDALYASSGGHALRQTKGRSAPHACVTTDVSAFGLKQLGSAQSASKDWSWLGDARVKETPIHSKRTTVMVRDCRIQGHFLLVVIKLWAEQRHASLRATTANTETKWQAQSEEECAHPPFFGRCSGPSAPLSASWPAQTTWSVRSATAAGVPVPPLARSFFSGAFAFGLQC